MCNLPGFTADAALALSAASARPARSNGERGRSDNARLAPQFDFPPWWPWGPPPYSPTGPFPPGPPPPPPPGWVYPPGWTPPYPGWTPPPGYPPPPAAGYTLGLGGTIAVALAAIAAGTAIGAGTGLGIEAAITEDETPAGSLDPACTNAPGPRTRRSLFKTYWGCERSLTKTINEAHAICGRRQRCVGGCTNGSTCIATATIDSVVQTIGFTGCETALYYTCDCGC